ncbi:MAG: protein-disulfide reductase DsbD family protein, partial [Bacteroidales bacterium]|nr:protein-disulfide reductase DsbD family protein [Bacteroidales bacterium]
MKSNTLIRFFLFSLMLFSFVSQAQILEPVKWDFSTEKISDGKYNLVFTATIEPKWHLYSQDIPMSPPATTFTFKPNEQAKLIGKVNESPSVEQYDPNFDMVLKFFSDEAVFKQQVELLTNESVTIEGVLEFMCCDDMRCLPPSEVDFSFTLAGTSALPDFSAQTTAPQNQVLDPVKWTYDLKKGNNDELELVFTAAIDEGFHLYSLNIPENGPLPTEFTFSESTAYELSAAIFETTEGEIKYDEIFEMDIKSFENEAVFVQPLTPKQETPFNITGEIAYMVCNDVGCVALYHDFDLIYNGKTIQSAEASQPVAQKESPKQAKADITGGNASLWGFFFLAFLGGL